jgi:hypothetical protein
MDSIAHSTMLLRVVGQLDAIMAAREQDEEDYT